MRTEVNEDKIKTELRGNEQDQFEAICKLYDRYAGPLASYIRERVAPTLHPHELTTAVNDVFLELAKKAKDGKFQLNGSVKTLLFRMAKCNAIDQFRQKCREQKRNVSDAFLKDGNDDVDFASSVAKKLADAPEIAATWKSLTQERTAADEVAANELMLQFRVWAAYNLSPLQRKVAEEIAIYCGDVTNEEICDEIAKTGKRPPISSVKSARKEIARKYKTLIDQKKGL